MLPRVQQTTNYDLFKDHTINRDIQVKTPKYLELEASMLKTGWWDSKAAVVYPLDRSGKHTIVEGHNRFNVAKEHKLVVKYLIDEQRIPLPEREDSGGRPIWSLADWVASHLKDGKNPNYQILNDFKNRTGIPISTSIALFMVGNKGETSDWGRDIRRGTLRISDTTHSEAVAEIVRVCTTNSIPYARRSGFIRAVSQVIRTGIAPKDALIKKIEMCVNIMKKKRAVTDYLSVLNEVYNYRQFPRIDLATEVRNSIIAEKRRLMEKNIAEQIKAGTRPIRVQGKFAKSAARSGGRTP